MRKKDQRVGLQAGPQDLVPHAGCAKRTDMLGILPGAAQPSDKRDWEALVHENSHVASTAGGWWAAR